MSSDTKLTKKQKKGLAFRERKGKGKARTADFEDNALPVMENPDEAEDQLGTDVAKAGVEAGVVEVQTRDAEAEPRGAKVVGESKKESKKRKRQPEEGEDGEQKTIPKKRKAKGKPVEKEGGDAEAVEDGETINSAEKGKGKGKEKQQRFILFVGEYSSWFLDPCSCIDARQFEVFYNEGGCTSTLLSMWFVQPIHLHTPD